MSDLTKDEYTELRKALDESVRPLFFFDDDPDGLASFLTLYRYKKDGIGVIRKNNAALTMDLFCKVEEYHPDAIFVLDISDIDQEFIDKARVPVYMVDHHKPIKRERLHYFNPRVHSDERAPCTSLMCYNIVNREVPAWIPLIGIVGDWMYTPEVKAFSQENPDLIGEEVSTPEHALFSTPFGDLVNTLSFILKGRVSETYRAITLLHKVKDPRDIMNKTSKAGEFIYKKVQKVVTAYNDLFSQAKARGVENGILEFVYTDDYQSVTKELSNRLYFTFPEATTLVGRQKGDFVKLSVRTPVPGLPDMMEKSLAGLRGSGGGHEHACGACISVDDYPQFFSRLKECLQCALENGH